MTAPATPEPGARALDTPEAREAVTAAIAAEATRLDAEDWSADDHFARSLADAALHALAPHVAAAQAAAWRAGVEAAAAVCDREADAAYGLAPLYVENDPLVAEGYYGRQEAAAECAREMRALPVPAAFAAPSPPSPIAGRPTDADLLWLCRHPGHSLAMVEIEGGFVPVLCDERGEGPVIPEGAAP